MSDDQTPTTKCDRYIPGTKNVWVEKGEHEGDDERPGICMLDTMDDAAVVYILERDEKARADLLTVTSDPHLLDMANNVHRLDTREEADSMQTEVNRNNHQESVPFYSIFRGQPPYNG